MNESRKSEETREVLVALVNSIAGSREELEQSFPGDVYDTDEVREKFIVEAFAAPFVIVRRKADNQRGTLTFQHDPRFYFDFQPE